MGKVRIIAVGPVVMRGGGWWLGMLASNNDSGWGMQTLYLFMYGQAHSQEKAESGEGRDRSSSRGE